MGVIGGKRASKTSSSRQIEYPSLRSPLMKIFRPFWLLSVLLALVLFVAGAQVASIGYLWVRGYHVIGEIYNGPGDVARMIVESDKPVEECWKIRTSFLESNLSSAFEHKKECVYLVAKLRKDPAICELLMPSEYGLSCIGEIWGKLIDESNCHWYQDTAVRCFEGEALVPRVTVCDEQSAKRLPDECLHRLAFRKKDAAICEAIEKPTLESVCEVRIRTWAQYPQLRSTRYFSVP